MRKRLITLLALTSVAAGAAAVTAGPAAAWPASPGACNMLRVSEPGMDGMLKASQQGLDNMMALVSASEEADCPL
jgi:hypothetical protein